MNLVIKYEHIFCLFLSLAVNLFGMESNSQLDYTFYFELLLRRITNIDHHSVGVLSLINQRLNTVIHETVEQRKEYLLLHVKEQPNIMRKQDFYVAYHALGSACALVDIDPINNCIYNVNLCRLQLFSDKAVSMYNCPIIQGYFDHLIERYRKNTYNVTEPYKRGHICDAWIQVPTFDFYGNVYVIHRNSVWNKQFIQISIDQNGKSDRKTILFEYDQRFYSPYYFLNTPFMDVFLKSIHIKTYENNKIYMADGVFIDGAPLTEHHKEQISTLLQEKEYG